MPKKPVAYTANYVCPDDNPVTTWQRQLTDEIHERHMRDMQPMITKDATHAPIKSDSPNKKKMQLIEGMIYIILQYYFSTNQCFWMYVDRQLLINSENEILVNKMQKILNRREHFSHFPEFNQNRPKPTNIGQRQKFQAKIKDENRSLKSYLSRVQGSYSVSKWERGAHFILSSSHIS
jgi:hypothetical protein